MNLILLSGLNYSPQLEHSISIRNENEIQLFNIKTSLRPHQAAFPYYFQSQ